MLKRLIVPTSDIPRGQNLKVYFSISIRWEATFCYIRPSHTRLWEPVPLLVALLLLVKHKHLFALFYIYHGFLVCLMFVMLPFHNEI